MTRDMVETFVAFLQVEGEQAVRQALELAIERESSRHDLERTFELQRRLERAREIAKFCEKRRSSA